MAEFIITDVMLPFDCAAPSTASASVRVENPPEEVVLWFLQYLFRKDSFWEGQWDAVRRSLQGKDSVVLLPTGGGKSIAFQLAALLLPGMCIVVDPIVALIEDQIDNLMAVGIDRCTGITAASGPKDKEQILRALGGGHYLFAYVVPERFQAVTFRDALRALTVGTPISLVAVDEAHCVSEWGHDFRPAYLNLGRVAREYGTSNGATPPLVALTGTASLIVLKDVQRELGVTDFEAIITPNTFDRSELTYVVTFGPSDSKSSVLQGILRKLPSDFAVTSSRFLAEQGDATFLGVIFCPHVNGPFGVGQIADELAAILGIRVEMYSGGAPRNANSRTWNDDKRAAARRFKRNQSPLLVATKAFGMGIDIPNIRYTVHLGLPSSLESFYQEAGRAGRDRQTARCTLIVSNDDPDRSTQLLGPDTTLASIKAVLASVKWPEQDDVTRALFFHSNSFEGIEHEVDEVRRICDLIGTLGERKRFEVVWVDKDYASTEKQSGPSRNDLEKALHRLLVLGVVEDYTVNSTDREISVAIANIDAPTVSINYARFVSAYNRSLGAQALASASEFESLSIRDAVLGVSKLLTEFVYEHIERARRSALYEMLVTATTATNSDAFRQRILSYLEHGEYDDDLAKVTGSDKGGLDFVGDIIDGMTSPNDAAALRGAVARTLSSYPDVPGLLLLRGIAEALARDGNDLVISQNIAAAIDFAVRVYNLPAQIVTEVFAQSVGVVADRAGKAEVVVREMLKAMGTDRAFLLGMTAALPAEFASEPAAILLQSAMVRVEKARVALGGIHGL